MLKLKHKSFEFNDRDDNKYPTGQLLAFVNEQGITKENIVCIQRTPERSENASAIFSFIDLWYYQ